MLILLVGIFGTAHVHSHVTSKHERHWLTRCSCIVLYIDWFDNDGRFVLVGFRFVSARNTFVCEL